MKKEYLLDLVMEKFLFDEKTSTGLIMSGKVLVNEIAVTKTRLKVGVNDRIRIKDQKEFVSRGAYKLLDAYESFGLDFKEKTCIDAGSSTGGFTEVLLLKGAKKVYAVDSGTNQLDFTLRTNPLVISLENLRVQDLTKDLIKDKVDLAVMDLSFTSSSGPVKYIKDLFGPPEIIVLVKPQFEYERLAVILDLSVNFNGIVENDDDRKKIIDYILGELKDFGLKIAEVKQCIVKGTKGNTEYLVYLWE